MKRLLINHKGGHKNDGNYNFRKYNTRKRKNDIIIIGRYVIKRY